MLNLIISSDFTDNLRCRHLVINSSNEVSISDLDLDHNDNYININSSYDGNQILIFNTNYNGVTSDQINFTINLDNTVLIGDLNYDGEISVIDVILTVNMILEGEFDNLADLNEDGFVNISDVILLVNIILN